MTLLPTTHGLRADIARSAPHLLHEGVTPRAARPAEGVHRPAPSALVLIAIACGARMALEAGVLSLFFAALLIWSAVLIGSL